MPDIPSTAQGAPAPLLKGMAFPAKPLLVARDSNPTQAMGRTELGRIRHGWIQMLQYSAMWLSPFLVLLTPNQ